MNPYRAYRRPEPSAGWTRIDLLLALYDGALERLDKADLALRVGDRPASVGLLARTQLIVSEMAAGVRLDGNEDLGTNMLRLYEFVTHRLRAPTADGIADARRILVTLREGFQNVRAEAADLERTGRLNPAERLQMVLTTA